MIICVVSDDNLETAIDVILENASENLVGDGKIFIYAVEDAIRIRTKTRGIEAIK
jgi:nitrogen regulatory protein P-II 1